MKSGLLSILITTLLLGGLTAQRVEDLVLDTDKLLVSRRYVCYKATQPINVDGRASDPDWREVRFTEDFIDIRGQKKPRYRTRVKMLWDEEYLYIYAELEEEHIWAKLTQHDTIIFNDNDFEVFLDPDNDGRNYSELEINALNTTWDLLLDKPYRLGGIANDFYEMEGLQSAIFIEGTLNDPSDIDSYWSVELAIPMESILLARHRGNKYPDNKDIWRINFSRVEWDHEIVDGEYERKRSRGKLLPEYNWVWSPQLEVNMHIPELWGYVQFSTNPADSKVNYLPEAEELTRQVSFELFRRFKFGNNQGMKQFTDRRDNYTKHLPPFSIENQDFEATYYKTPHGFEVVVFNRTLNKKYMIDESGYLSEMGNY